MHSSGSNIITLINPNYQKHSIGSTQNSVLLSAQSTHYTSISLPQLPLPPQIIQLSNSQIQKQQNQEVNGPIQINPPLKQSLQIVPPPQYAIKSTSPTSIRIFPQRGLNQADSKFSLLPSQVQQGVLPITIPQNIKDNNFQNIQQEDNQNSQLSTASSSNSISQKTHKNQIHKQQEYQQSKQQSQQQPQQQSQQQPLQQSPQQPPPQVQIEIEKQPQVQPLPMKKKYKNLVDSDSEDEIEMISIKKKKVHIEEKPQNQLETKEDLTKQSNTIVIQVPPLNINKSFQDVLSQTSKDSNSLTMVRNILSAGSKKLAEKQTIFKKKWNQLRNSNCSHEEYIKWEDQLKSSEIYEIKDIKETIISRLINNKITGFVSQEQLVDRGKSDYLISKGLKDDITWNFKEFVLEEKQYDEFRNDQFKLLEKLMRQNNLVATDHMKHSNYQLFEENSHDTNLIGDGNNGVSNNKTDAEKQLEFLDEEENQVQRISLCKYFQKQESSQAHKKPSLNLLNGFFSQYQQPQLNQSPSQQLSPYPLLKQQLQTQSQQQPNVGRMISQMNGGNNIQNVFKDSNNNNNNNNNNYNNNNIINNSNNNNSSTITINNNNNNSNEIESVEGNIEKYAFEKIFSDYNQLIKLQQSDTCKIAKRVRLLLLDIKSDELFTDAKFQKETFEKYSRLLKTINECDQADLAKIDNHTIQELVELSAYIMNNVHYFQKFNLKCDLLHPLDLIFVLDKVLKPDKNKKKM